MILTLYTDTSTNCRYLKAKVYLKLQCTELKVNLLVPENLLEIKTVVI